MVCTYCWNLELAEALYPALAALEITLRNSIHDNLSTREGTDLWFWSVLRMKDRPKFDERVRRLRRRLGHPPTVGQIVAEQSFGFWTMLLGQNYHQRLWAPQGTALIRSTFPYLPATPNNRQFLERHYRLLQELRNRVMHYEPIWNGVYWNGQTYTLPDLYQRILDGIDWTSPAMSNTLQISDRFGTVYQNGWERIEGEVSSRFSLS